MDSHYKCRLDKNRVAILEDLTACDVLDQLIQDGILDQDDHDLVQAEKTRKEQTKKLLEIIYHRGPNAYKCFRESLTENYDWLVEKLDQTAIQKREAVCKQKAVIKLDAKTLHKVTHHPKVMRDWTSVARLLEVPEADIAEIEYANPRQLSNAVYEMITVWQSRFGRNATGAVLQEALEMSGMAAVLDENHL